mgnify:CR=1 FL=1
MDALENIFSRRSVRNYLDQEIREEDIKTILTAGKSGRASCRERV